MFKTLALMGLGLELVGCILAVSLWVLKKYVFDRYFKDGVYPFLNKVADSIEGFGRRLSRGRTSFGYTVLQGVFLTTLGALIFIDPSLRYYEDAPVTFPSAPPSLTSPAATSPRTSEKSVEAMPQQPAASTTKPFPLDGVGKQAQVDYRAITVRPKAAPPARYSPGLTKVVTTQFQPVAVVARALPSVQNVGSNSSLIVNVPSNYGGSITDSFGHLSGASNLNVGINSHLSQGAVLNSNLVANPHFSAPTTNVSFATNSFVGLR